MRIKFTGHSDDIIQTDINGATDEIGAYNSEDHIHAKTVRVETIGGSQGVDIHCLYDGCWSFAVSQVEEDRSLPPWTFTIENAHSYSAALIVDTGADMVMVTVTAQEKP